MAKTAKYKQVVDWVKNRIETGELRDGDKLETEQEIGKRFGISRQTVRHGLEQLGGRSCWRRFRAAAAT